MKKLPDRDKKRSAANPCLPILKGMNNGSGKLPQGQQQFMVSWQRLVAQAHRINQLSQELEMAMFEFKAIANTVNTQWHSLQTPKRSQPPHQDTHTPSFPLRINHDSLCHYQTITIPFVGEKPNGTLLLTTKPVDLFRAEREAVQLAQTLRNRTKQKRTVLPSPRKKQRRIHNSPLN